MSVLKKIGYVATVFTGLSAASVAIAQEAAPDAGDIAQMIESQKCDLASQLAENMTADIQTGGSLTGMSQGFDDILDDAILKIDSRSTKIQALCPLPTGP